MMMSGRLCFLGERDVAYSARLALPSIGIALQLTRPFVNSEIFSAASLRFHSAALRNADLKLANIPASHRGLRLSSGFV